MANILSAINNIIINPITELRNHYEGRNRANNVGDALEYYVKDAFANTIDERNNDARNQRYAETFSYLGNQNNPPDMILAGGDAIEVKKIQAPNSDLALNSSYPKSKLYSDSPMITEACRNCENWNEKDIIYVVGHTTDRNLISLWMVYGSIYAAPRSVYERIKTTISEGIRGIPDVEFAETNELGRVNRVDPLGITYLRIRGMWSIQNPTRVYSDYYHTPANATFNLVIIIPLIKYESFSEADRNTIINIENANLRIQDIRVLNPGNPAQTIPSKLITFNLF